jgi:transposase
LSKNCPECFRRENAEFFETHATKEDLAKFYKISVHTIMMWKKRYGDIFPKAIRGIPHAGKGRGNAVYLNKAEVDQFLLWRSGQERVGTREDFTKPKL